MVEPSFAKAPAIPDWLAEDYPFARRVFRNGAHRIHFVDEGSGPVVLLLHGNPTWSYLWRRVIARLIPGGVRVIAPDLVGLGLSSKPRDASVHTLDFHANQTIALVAALQPGPITIVGQDWGGPILGLVAARQPAWVRGAVFANTSLRKPRVRPRMSAFHRFANLPWISDLAFLRFGFPLQVLHRVQADSASIGPRQKRAYRYPLRDPADRVAPLALARMVPTTLSHPTVATLGEVERWAGSFRGPTRLVWGMRDPILGRSVHGLRKLMPQAVVTEADAGHFLQEEVPLVLAEAILEAVARA